MKKNKNNINGLYAYLNQLGVLKNGTAAEIQQAKKTYWNNYKREWKKRKRQSFKSFLVYFDQSEMKILKRMIPDKQSVTAYIKWTALARAHNETILDKIRAGKVRKVLFDQYNLLETFFKKGDLSKDIKRDILSMVQHHERAILNILIGGEGNDH